MKDGAGRPVQSWSKLFRDGKLASDSSRIIDVRQDRETSRFSTKLRHNSQEILAPDGTMIEQIAMDLSDIDQVPVIVQHRRKRAGLPPLSYQEIEALKEQIHNNVQTINQPEVIYQTEVDVGGYKPAIAKIVYELAWLWLGEAYIEDPRAATLRDYICGRRDDLPNAHMEFNQSFEGFAPWAKEPDAHIAVGVSQGRSHAIAVRIFSIFVGVVEVTTASERYDGTSWPRFLLIDPIKGVRRESTLQAETDRIMRRSGQARESVTPVDFDSIPPAPPSDDRR